MSNVPWRLREDAADLEREDERLTREIEDTERRIVDLRHKREDVRLHRADAMAAANALDSLGFRVERNDSGIVTVSIDHSHPDTETAGEAGHAGTVTTTDRERFVDRDR